MIEREMNKLLLVVGFLTAQSYAQDMRGNAGRSLFSDVKAARVGDAVMVLVVENTSAVNDARTATSRGTDVGLGANMSTGSGSGTDISAGIGTDNKFKGEGITSNSGSVRSKISARVDSVFANGNLAISGARSITVNGEEQKLQISGVVRPADVMADNSVFSFNISDARIVVQGDGSVTEVQEPGLITKFLRLLF
jgi:flagellar L-ring protein precursor FlgH